MTKPFQSESKEFFLTSPTPCPYLPGRQERKIFTFLGGKDAEIVNADLSERGFRRSQNIAYLPACDRCRACRSVRVPVADFSSRRWKRLIGRNRDLVRTVLPAKTTAEQFGVLRSYLDARHAEGGMADMTALDYAAMVEQTPVSTEVVEYREGGELIACSLRDRFEGALSMVYSFFDPAASKRSPGTFMILDHIIEAAETGLDYVYLGYWIEGSRKMDYKRRFTPLEALTSTGWQTLPRLPRNRP
ncbi:arginyl-tRNA-protein transferase [Parvularcula bermudensis HTCC2503]|uniref:Aspartate/glutamate leucyltransferase n=1 Tax=Parvularcula bermudensis (strain ATCC BAA-594 / HTCC2503 / KCTC 12087) TaxID=314260 RepID=E0TBA3_PARBH|nr:arginyltransferase [Parvularcula bermudensis]ADM08307.1 arginyl-tRNA-protein transferase [Parvularcula bermudensis HTCC2503]